MRLGKAEVATLGYLRGDGDRRRDNQVANSQVIGKKSAVRSTLPARQKVNLTIGRKAGRNHTAAPRAPLTVP
jgi:hypothetical protein